MKRAFRVFIACAALLLCLPSHAFAINFDGYINPGEWFDYPAAELFPGDSMCGITSAMVRFSAQQGQVMFGFFVRAPDIAADSPVGAAFLLGGREIGRWQQGCGAANYDADYDLRGAAWLPSDGLNSYCNYEIVLGCKTEAALTALRELSVQLFDPQGVLSRASNCPVVTAEPVTATKAATTEKTTATKAPTTEKTTTTKAPATEKTTTTKAPATEKPTTTLPAYTPAPTTTATTRAPAAAQAAVNAAAAPASTSRAQQTQPAASRTETTWYTVIYTETPGSTDAAGQQSLWTADPFPAEESQTLPTLAVPAPQDAQPASRNTALLCAAAGLLGLLGAALLAFWIWTQRKTKEQPEAPN